MELIMELTLDQALQKGVEAHKAGQVQEADRLYTAILKAQPKHPDANHNMGVLAVGVGKVQEALPFFKTALKANPNTIQFWLSYIDALIKLKRLADAKAVFEQAKSNGAKGDGFDKLEKRLNESQGEPLKSTATLTEEDQSRLNILDNLKLDQAITLAKKKSKEGSPGKAKRIYQDVLVKFPKNKRALDGLKGLTGGSVGKASKVEDPPPDKVQSIISFYNQGQLAAVVEQAQALTEEYPEAFIVWNILGAAAAQIGKLDQAIIAFQKVNTINPDYAEGYINMGSALKEQGKLEEAIEAYNKALAIKPDYDQGYINMGNALKEQGKLEEAIEAYNKALAIKPDYAEGYNNMGVTLQEQGKLEEAIEAYNKALAIKPDYADVQVNMGIALKEQGKLDDAIGAYNKALTIKPDNAAAYNNMGNALQEQGKLDEAIEALNKALAIKPDYAKAYNNLGYTLQKQGKLDDAIQAFKKDGSKLSQIYLLKCLYEQNKQAAFYDQLDYLINQGVNNAVLGSYLSRSQIRYGINKENPFCNAPLKYVLHTNLTDHYDFDNIFVKGATDILTKNTVQNRSQNLLTNGIQTTGNVFNQIGGFTNKIQGILHSEIESYRMHFKDSQEGLIKSWPSDYEIYGWLVSMKSGGKLAAHMHDKGWISGSVYINVPPKVNEDSGNLVVCLDSEKDNKSLSIDVVTGSLCLFPSSLLHYTIPFESDKDRIVLAFDVIPK
jgi:tetratricopeptide (TPR) repeat protein